MTEWQLFTPDIFGINSSIDWRNNDNKLWKKTGFIFRMLHISYPVMSLKYFELVNLLQPMQLFGWRFGQNVKKNYNVNSINISTTRFENLKSEYQIAAALVNRSTNRTTTIGDQKGCFSNLSRSFACFFVNESVWSTIVAGVGVSKNESLIWME